MSFKLYLFFAFTIFIRTIFAQAPEGINYQAIARDNSGNPLASTPVNIQFDIRQNTPTGTVVYSETHSLTTNQFGLFTAVIGNGSTSNNFSTITWGTAPYYLEVTINGDVMTATQLLSVPYALYAKESANGPTGAQGPPGIGINWLGAFTTAPATPSLNDAYYDQTLGQSFIWDGTAWQIIAQDGTVGSLTGGPGITIIGSTINNTGDLDSTNELQTLTYNQTTQSLGITNGNNVTLDVNDADNDPTNEIELPATATNNDVLTWNGSSWVALSPSTGNDNQNLINGGKIGNNQTVNIQNGTGVTFSVADADSSVTNETITAFGVNGANLEITEAGTTHQVPLSSLSDGDWTINGTHLENANTGNVGIGPMHSTIGGPGYFLTSGKALTIATANSYTTVPPAQLELVSSSAAGADIMGRVAFGHVVSAPTLPTYVGGIEMNKNGNMMFATGGDNERVRITSSGNVGVSTVAPISKFHVANGHITMQDGNQQMGYIPVSNANGTMTWTDPSTISTASFWASTNTGSIHPTIISDNVGIGTTTPSFPLNVVAAGTTYEAARITNTAPINENHGLRAESSNATNSNTGIWGLGTGGNYATGIYAYGSNGVNQSIGVDANASGASLNYGVHADLAFATTGSSYAIFGNARGSGSANNTGVYGAASGATVNWAGYFASGDVYIQNDLRLGVTTAGSQNPKLYINSLATSSNNTSIEILNQYNGASTTYGIYNRLTPGGTGGVYGIWNYIIPSASSNGVVYGLRNLIQNNGNGTRYGLYSLISANGSGVVNGSYNSINHDGTGDVYGFRLDASASSTSGNVYGLYITGPLSMENTIMGNTGIGVLNPVNRLDVEGAAVIGATYSGTNTAPTNGLLVAGNVGIGTTAPNSKLHVNETSTNPALRVQVNGATRFIVANNGNVALNNNTVPAFMLHLSANSAGKPTSSVWTVTSDARLKKNVKPYEGGLSDILKINPVWYTYNGKAGLPEETGVGVIAQDLQKIAPYMIKPWTYTEGSMDEENPRVDGEKTEYLGVDNGAMTYMLINAIKEQQKMIEELKFELEKLKKQ